MFPVGVGAAFVDRDRQAFAADLARLVSVFGYTHASCTLKADLTSEYACRLLDAMTVKGMYQCTPVRGDAAIDPRVPSGGAWPSLRSNPDIQRPPSRIKPCKQFDLGWQGFQPTSWPLAVRTPPAM